MYKIYSHVQKCLHPTFLSNNAPLHTGTSCSSKCLGIFIFTFLMFVYVFHRKVEKIATSDTFHTKNWLDKIIGTLNLIFGSTALGKNNWNQSLPVTINEFLTPHYRNFGTLCSPSAPGVSAWKGFFFPTAVLRSLHKCSMGFRSRLISQHFVLNHFWGLFVCFGSLCETHDLRQRRNFLTLGLTLVVGVLCTGSWHPVPEAAKQTKNISEPPPSLTVGTIFFSLKALYPFLKTHWWTLNHNCDLGFFIVCSQHILPKGFWLSWVRFGKLQSGFLCFCVSNGVLLGLLPKHPFSFRWQCILQANTVVPCVCRSVWICLEVDRGSVCTIQTILHCSLWSINQLIFSTSR